MHDRKLPLVAALLVGVASCSPPPPAGTGPREVPWAGALRPVVDSLYRASGYPGLSVGVAFRDGESAGLAAGWADTAARKPLSPHHKLLQGSVGKTYAAALALQLAAEGKLSLDSPVSRYLGAEPWFPRVPNGASMTVRQLMNHTSGLVRYEFEDEFTRDLTAAPDRTWKPEELLAYVLDGSAPFAAGQGWEYSDTNYIVLGMILERVTGRPYYEEIRRRFLRPLGLRETVPTDRRLIPGLSQGYAGADNPFGRVDEMVGPDGRLAVNPQFEWTGGGMASTAEDLARWGVALYGGPVLTPAMREEMLRGVPAPLGPPGTTYGLGVIVRPLAPGTSWGHSGFFPGYLAEMAYFPEDGLAVAVQVNSSALPQGALPPARVLGAIVRAVRAARAATAPSVGGQARPGRSCAGGAGVSCAAP